ncbi:TlpA disulfide reductase family protein [Streptomyces sp. NPDC127097]|uniref:TlpA disulfide reductase family protein n=1 Tax=Streptomyces sp. NPDC127097 TaxID=3347136 RepID=UPI003659AE18
MNYLIASVVLVGLLCVFNLVLTYGIVRRLREPVAGAGGKALEVPQSVLGAGATVGSFSATDTEGSSLTRDDLPEGQLVTFMAPGCPACEELLPLVAERAREYGPERVLAVVVRDAGKENVGEGKGVREYLERLAPVARVMTCDLGDELTAAFALTGVPAYVEMGRGGRVASSGRTLPHRAEEEPRRTEPVKAA